MVYDAPVLVYLQLKMWICLFIKVEKCSSFPEDICYLDAFTNICIAINSNLLDKNRTQDKIKYHIQHESWLRWIVIKQISYKENYFLFIYPEINVASTF